VFDAVDGCQLAHVHACVLDFDQRHVPEPEVVAHRHAGRRLGEPVERRLGAVRPCLQLVDADAIGPLGWADPVGTEVHEHELLALALADRRADRRLAVAGIVPGGDACDATRNEKRNRDEEDRDPATGIPHLPGPRHSLALRPASRTARLPRGIAS
jgi:hypothetical protein